MAVQILQQYIPLNVYIFIFTITFPNRKYIAKHLMKILQRGKIDCFISLQKLKTDSAETNKKYLHSKAKSVHPWRWTNRTADIRNAVQWADTYSLQTQTQKHMLSMPFCMHSACKYFCTCVHSYRYVDTVLDKE